jgi:hypothetical protein
MEENTAKWLLIFVECTQRSVEDEQKREMKPLESHKLFGL